MNAPPETAACEHCGAALTPGKVCVRCLARSLEADLHGVHTGAPRDDEVPVVVGWRILELIGTGGIGRVYRVESEKDGGVAALKVLDRRWVDDEIVAMRFEAEASALRLFDHPHIVRVLATTESEDGRFCLVMEFVDGCDLGRLLRAEKLAPERALDIFQKVCGAVSHAHERGYVHRDIKPANILIGRDGTVKLVDFGLAKDITLDTNDRSVIGGLTSTTDQFGTAYYIAPERFLHRRHSGASSDVFSLGVLLYHQLTGQMPLGKYTPLSQVTGLSPKWDGIIARALEADPAQRTSSVRELDDAAQALWRAHRDGTEHRARRKRFLTLVGAALLGIALLLSGAWWQRERMRPKPVVFPLPSAATQQAPWENSLGMKFVPVPGTKVLFSIYEVRRRDAEPFLKINRTLWSDPWNAAQDEARQEKVKRAIPAWRRRDGTEITLSWDDLGWPVTPDHPTSLVLLRDARRYCLWLTWKEQNEGRLQPGQHYRLPTDAEWLTACGGKDAPLRPGNLAGTEARDDNWLEQWPTLPSSDPFPRSAPVGSFPVEPFGLYDMSGNVAEWVCETDIYSTETAVEAKAHLRGPSFTDGTPSAATFAAARPYHPFARLPIAGVRLVLAWQ